MDALDDPYGDPPGEGTLQVGGLRFDPNDWCQADAGENIQWSYAGGLLEIWSKVEIEPSPGVDERWNIGIKVSWGTTPPGSKSPQPKVEERSLELPTHETWIGTSWYEPFEKNGDYGVNVHLKIAMEDREAGSDEPFYERCNTSDNADLTIRVDHHP